VLKIGFGDDGLPFGWQHIDKFTVIVGKLVELSAEDSKRCCELREENFDDSPTARLSAYVSFSSTHRFIHR
jgi:hypothetical protein